MAEQIYYSVFTKQGLALLTEAIQNGTKLGITSMAFGDGGGSLPVPTENFTALIREVHRTQLNSLAPDPNNANWLRAEAIIASAVGGFNIRELGLYAGDVLVAYSNYPATYKPNPADGTARIMTFRMILQIDNTASFELVINPDVVLATLTAVHEAKEEVYKNTGGVVETVENLADIEKWHGRTITTKCYHRPTNYALARPFKGGSNYVFDSTRSNENDKVSCINGWILISETIDVLQAGAKGDGITDDSDAFQAAIDYAVKAGIDKVYVPAGNYIITKSIELAGTGGNSREGVTLVGHNSRSTFLYLKTSQDIPLILSKSWSGSHTGHGIRGISLYAHENNKYLGTGIKLVGTCFMRVSDFNIYNFNVGLHLYNTREFGTNNDAGNAFCEYNQFTNGRIHTNNTNILLETYQNGDSSFHGNGFDNVQNQIKKNGVGVYIKGQQSKLAVWYNSFIFMNFWTSTSIEDDMTILKCEYAQCSGLSGQMVCEGIGFIKYSNTAFNFEGNFTSLRGNEYPVFDGDDKDVIGGASINFNNLTSRSYNPVMSPNSVIAGKYLQVPKFLETKARNYANDRLSVATIKRITNSNSPVNSSYEGLAIGARTDCEVFFGEFPVDGGEYAFKPRIGVKANSPGINIYSDLYNYDINFYNYAGTLSTDNTGYNFSRSAISPKVTGVATLGNPTNKFYQGWFTGWTISQNGITPTTSKSYDIGTTSAVVNNIHTSSTMLNSSIGVIPTTTATYSIGSSSMTWNNIYTQNAVTVVSDENHKADILELNEVEIACAKACAKLYRKYKLRAAIEQKGQADARYHFGAIAQQIVQCFTNHGLDWREYGIITFEAWPAIQSVEYKAAIYDEEGKELAEEIHAIEAREAGEIYMMRYEEFNCFVNAGMEAMLSELEERLLKLENHSV